MPLVVSNCARRLAVQFPCVDLEAILSAIRSMRVFVAWQVPVCNSKAAIQLDMDISTSVWQKHYSDFPTPQIVYLHRDPPDARAVTYVLLSLSNKAPRP